MKKIILWILCIFAAALLVLSFPARELFASGIGDIIRIAGFVSLLLFIAARTLMKDDSRQN